MRREPRISGICCGALASVMVFAATVADADARSRGARRDAVTEIVIHATGGPFCQSGRVMYSPAGTVERIKRFFENSGSVSIHYIVGPDGEVARSVPEDEIAIHTVGRNEASIGIELVNAGDGREPYPEAQLKALSNLIGEIRRRWRLPKTAVIGHDEVDHSVFTCGGRQVRRKQDPGPLFPWARFRGTTRQAATAG